MAKDCGLKDCTDAHYAREMCYRHYRYYLEPNKGRERHDLPDDPWKPGRGFENTAQIEDLKRRKMEMEVGLLEGSLLPANIYRRKVTEMFGAIASALDAAPGRIRLALKEILSDEDLRVVMDVIDTELDEVRGSVRTQRDRSGE